MTDDSDAPPSPSLTPEPAPSTEIRSATEADVPQILRFVRGLAEYEKLSHQVVATEENLRRTLFGDRPYAEVLFACEQGQPAGFALFFHNYSTFLGAPGLYLEDLFVSPEHRGRGHGKALLAHLARLAVERGCGRLDWVVLDWNESAIRFYESLGARGLDDWRTFRLTGQALRELGLEAAGADIAGADIAGADIAGADIASAQSAGTGGTLPD